MTASMTRRGHDGPFDEQLGQIHGRLLAAGAGLLAA